MQFTTRIERTKKIIGHAKEMLAYAQQHSNALASKAFKNAIEAARQDDLACAEYWDAEGWKAVLNVNLGASDKPAHQATVLQTQPAH